MNDDRGHPESAAAAAAQERRWNRRVFVTTGALLSGLTLPLSGLADHVAGGPGGPSVGWSVMHISLGAIFVGFSAWHAALNRRALLRYLRVSVHALPSREVLAAAALTARRRGLGAHVRPRAGRAMSAASGMLEVLSRIGPRHRGATETPFVVLDRSCCEACWSCVEACPEAVLGKVEIFRHRHAVVEAGERCTGCLRCVKACKAGALSKRAGQTASQR